MSSKHITVRLIRDLLDGRISASAFIQKITDHCGELCAVCRENLAEAQEILGELPRPRPSISRPVIPAGVLTTIERMRRMDEAARHEYLTRLIDRKAGPSTEDLTEGLLAETRLHVPNNPREIVTWATLAHEALIAGGSERHDLLALTFAHLGNGKRLLGETRAAKELLERAQVTATRSRNPEAQAEVGSLRGSLLTRLRRYDEAARELLRAARLIQDRDPSAHAKILIQLGIVADLVGEPKSAIKTTKQALALLEKEHETRLYLYARFNLAQHLFTAERFEECRSVLAEDEDLWNGQEDEWTGLRLWWLEARLALVEGDGRFCERALSAIRRRFADIGKGFDTALVTLDLALLYLKQGRLEDIAPLAEEMLEIFVANEMHPEVFSVLKLMTQELVKARASEEAIKKCYRYLREASIAPTEGVWGAN